MENAPEEIPLRLRWRATWPDKDADFVAEASSYDGPVGRIYLHDTGGYQNGNWFWAFQAAGDDVSRNVGSTSGYEASARAAARRVEAAWFLAIAGTRHETPETVSPVPTVNSYAAAKGR